MSPMALTATDRPSIGWPFPGTSKWQGAPSIDFQRPHQHPWNWFAGARQLLPKAAADAAFTRPRSMSSPIMGCSMPFRVPNAVTTNTGGSFLGRNVLNKFYGLAHQYSNTRSVERWTCRPYCATLRSGFDEAVWFESAVDPMDIRDRDC